MDKEDLVCSICGGRCFLLDVVDFNKSCEETKGKFLVLSGIPVYYAICSQCGFCFTPALYAWTLDEFEKNIYNDDYVFVDPDYIETRPRAGAANLLSMFENLPPSIRHLDYGGGKGLLAKILRESNWNSISYDPFVDRDINIEQLGEVELITAYEVFEHVPDVQKLMSNLRSLLSSNGLVLFSTLASDEKIRPFRRLDWWYASPRNGHISLFSRKSLAILAQKNGFKFASFSEGLHVFFTNIPPWAAHLVQKA